MIKRALTAIAYPNYSVTLNGWVGIVFTALIITQVLALTIIAGTIAIGMVLP